MSCDVHQQIITSRGSECKPWICVNIKSNWTMHSRMSNCQLVIIQNVILTELAVAHKHWEGGIQHVQHVYASAATRNRNDDVPTHYLSWAKPSNQKSPVEVLGTNTPLQSAWTSKVKGKRWRGISLACPLIQVTQVTMLFSDQLSQEAACCLHFWCLNTEQSYLGRVKSLYRRLQLMLFLWPLAR